MKGGRVYASPFFRRRELRRAADKECSMRFDNIVFDDIDTNLGNGKCDCVLNVFSSDELVNVVNGIRVNQGYTDFVGVEYDNFDELSYAFYLYVDVDNKEITMNAQVFDEKETDDIWHNIELTPEEKQMLLWKVTRYLL